MLNFKNLPEKTEFKKGKFIRPGIQNLILRDITLQTSHNTGNERPVFSMETEPINEPGWEGYEGAKGQIGNIFGNFGFYLKTDSQKQDFMANLEDIMKAAGTYEDFMQANGDTNFTSLADVIAAVKPFVVGKAARYFVAGQQYMKLDQSGVGLKLKFPSKRMVETLDSESKFPKFDDTNKNHFEKLEKKAELPKVTSDDLPF